MAETENFAAFLNRNKKLAREYLDIRLQILKLQGISVASKSAGYLIWIILSMFFLFLLMVFAGLVTGFWLSDLTGSYVKGFGLTTLIMLAVIILLALLRKVLFVNPIIRQMIKLANEATDDDNN